MPDSLLERIWDKLDMPGFEECWTSAATPSAIYPRICIEGQQYDLHRVVYELLVGSIPPRYHVDHLCRNQRCCNPSHLEAVPPRVNFLRGDSPAAVNARKPRCPKCGADFVPMPREERAKRYCRPCMLQRMRDYYYRNKKARLV